MITICPYMHIPIVLATFLEGRVPVLVGDITRQHVDAVVNAANETLQGGGGVDFAIHEAGGPWILEECREIRRTRHPQGLPTGQAIITGAGLMPAKYVIHTVGPIKGVWRERDAEMLAACYRNSMSLAIEHGLSSMAFPAISTGIYAYPREEAAAIASETIEAYLATGTGLKEVRLVFYTERDAQVFLQNQRFKK